MNLNPEIQANLKQIDDIESKFHRDLLALLYSPFVFADFFPKNFRFKLLEFPNFEKLLTWFRSIESKPHPTNLDRLRLGKYAEELMLFYFQNSNHFSVIDANLQLIDGKITVGEIDFLLEEKQNLEKIHLELAIKFFLEVTVDGSVEWIGPSTKDNLSKKQSKLMNRQLKIPKQYPHLLPFHLQLIEFKPQILLKGAAFIEFKKYTLSENPLKNAWWLHVEELDSIKQPNLLFAIVPNRKDWIFPFNKRLERMNFQQLKFEILDYLELQNEIMITRFLKDGTPIDRGFIVRSNWPH
jgi:hypothetical protein